MKPVNILTRWAWPNDIMTTGRTVNALLYACNQYNPPPPPKNHKSRGFLCDTPEKSQIVREPVISLIKWLRPKGLKVCSYVEKYAEFKNQTLKKIGWYTKVLFATEYPHGMQYLKIALKWGYPCRLIL